MTTIPGATLGLLCLLAPSGDSVGAEPPQAEVDDAGFIGPVSLVAIDDAASSGQGDAAPRPVEPGSPAWFQIRSWSFERSSLSVLGQAHVFGSAPMLPSLRTDQVEGVLALAWRPRRSWVSVFFAFRATSSAMPGADGPEVRAGVGAMAGLRIALPSLVHLLRRWRAR